MRAQARLLIVDDSSACREILGSALVAHGFDVVGVGEGSAALDLVERRKFDLVLLDMVMPEPSGLAVLRAARRQHSRERLPIIMMTASGDERAHVEALSLGANDYISKPLNLPIVIARIMSQLAVREAGEMQRRANVKLKAALRELVETKRRLEAEIALRREFEELMQHLARHDALTGLGNRLLFEEEINRAVARMKRRGERFALLCLDLDGLKGVNDTLGHHAGDELLRIAAKRIKDCLRETDTVARIGGDEFVVIQSGVKSPADCSKLGERIIESVAPSCHISGQDISVTCSVGIALAEGDADHDILLKQADLALYRAKARGGNAYCMHSATDAVAEAEQSDVESPAFRAELGSDGLAAA